MLNAIIDFSLRNRLLVLVGTVALAVLGGLALRYLTIDAFPDTTPVQVQINTVAPALNSLEVEQQITFPVEQAIGGLPRLEGLRSISQFGLSQVTVVFADGTDIYFARQLVNERLATVVLPAGIERPKMGPVATGLGEVFHYALTAPGYDSRDVPESERVKKLTELRTLHDWVVKPKLRTAKGTAEVNGWGGYEKQYQLRIHPERLVKYDLTLEQVMTAVEQNNRNVGGGSIRRGSQMLLVAGLGRTVNIEQIQDIVVAAKKGVPIRVKDVADVQLGHEIRRGAMTADGKGEIVLGLGFMLMGENPHQVARNLKEKLKDVQAALPQNVKVETLYDRTELVDQVIHTVRNNLLEAGLLVVAVLFLFLGNVRAALIVALAIPLSLLFAFSGMLRFSIAASLLSLGAIDFGMVVDSSVVMIENCVRHLAEGSKSRSKLDVIRDAALEVRKPTMFGELIIMIVYLPILTLEGIEGKMYRPMALTVIFALAGSMVLSLTLMPVLASLLLPRRIQEREPLLMRLAHAIHTPILNFAMRQKFAVLGLAAIALALAFGVILPRLGSEFVPRLSEGAIAVSITRLPATHLDESVRVNKLMERAVLKEFPTEVAHVWTRAGTAEVATDPMTVEQLDFIITLKPRAQWRADIPTQAVLTNKISDLLREFPLQKMEFSQPIEQRVKEITSGVRSDVAVKLFGDDLEILRKKAAQVEAILNTIPGKKEISTEQLRGQPVLEVKVKQDELARYGVPAKTVLDLVQSVGSLPLGEVIEGQMRFPLVARLPERWRKSAETLRSIPVATAAGEQIPLERLASVEIIEEVPVTIKREWGQRVLIVKANVVSDGDLGGFVAEAQRKVAERVQMPPGRYHIEWSGDFEHLESGRKRLWLVFLLALVLIAVLLYLTYGNFVDPLRVVTAIPFAAVGGLFALWLRGMPLSISAGIGFIAMSGVAMLDYMILASYIRQLRRKGIPRDEAVRQAAVTRLRPVLMTTLVASLGFLPMALSTGVGAEVQRPLATVVIGGVLSAMVMSLLVIRVLYVFFDWLAGLFRRLSVWGLGLRPEQLAWIFGEHHEEKPEGAPADGRPAKEAITASP